VSENLPCSASNTSLIVKSESADQKGDNEVPLEVEDLLTIHLDLLASREGFERGKEWSVGAGITDEVAL
jgi:hypothetical protein